MEIDIFSRMPEGMAADYSKLVNSEAKRIFLAEWFSRDFLSFVWMLGYRDFGEFHLGEVEELSKFRLIGDDPVRRMWLWARGHFKTTLVTISHTVWLIVNNPDSRGLIVSNTLDIAKKIFAEVREHFVRNEDFRYFFREFCPRAGKDGKVEFGTTEQFTIPNRKRILKEPTLMVAGLGTNLTTLHFDYQKIDDIVTRDSVSNDEQIKASKEYYASLRSLFDNPEVPREDVVGTVYHFNDLYWSVLKGMPEFKLSYCPALKNGEVLFKERFTEEGLQSILNDPSVGPLVYASQYLLNPINPGDAKFKEQWWKEYDGVPDGLTEYVCADPASTQKKKSDYTVIERWGVDAEGNHYLLDGVRDKLTVFQRIDEVVRMAKDAKRLRSIKYEVLGGRHGDLESLKQRCLEEKLHIIPTETKSTNASKADRIEQRLVGQFNAGKIFFPRSLPKRSVYDGKPYDFVKEYKSEYLQFPFCGHDDILDCHSQMFEDPMGIEKGLKSKTNKKREWGTADDWDALYASIDREQRGNPFLTKEQVMTRLRNKRIERLTGLKVRSN